MAEMRIRFMPGFETDHGAKLRSIAIRDANELLRIEKTEAFRASKAGKLKEWSTDFYVKHRERISLKIAALGIPESYAADYCRRHAETLATATPETLDKILRGWEDTEPSAMADQMEGV